MEWEERKRRRKRKKITDGEQTKGGGEREEGPDTFYSCSISTSTPIIQYGLTPLVLTGYALDVTT